MASIAAKKVATEVLETLRKGKRPNLGKIAIKNGYSKKTALNPQNITETQSYKDTLDPFVKAMIKERNRLILALSKKKLSRERYKDMIDGIDKLTKNTQLLTGGKTGNDDVKISWE